MNTKLLTHCALALVFGFTSLAHAADKWRVSVADLQVSKAVNAKQARIIENSSLIKDIENSIRNGRKFELLTRRGSAMQAIRDEQNFAKSGLAAGDAAHEGQLQNAQSIVQVEVTDFAFGRSARAVPNLDNKYKVSDYCKLHLAVQILDTTKGTVTASFLIKENMSTPQVMNNGVGAASTALLDKTLMKAAGDLANQLSDTIFPLRVLMVKGKQIYVNRGNDSGMKKGDVFIVYEPGETLIDPQTGENLGSTETEVAQAKVVRINPKNSVLEIVKGDVAEVQKDFILRRPQ